MIPTSVSKAFGSFGTSDTSKLVRSFHLETYFHVGRRFGSLGWGGGRPAWGFVPALSLLSCHSSLHILRGSGKGPKGSF